MIAAATGLKLGWRWTAIKNGAQDALAYRMEFVLDFIGQAIVPVVVQLVLWYALFRNHTGAVIAGMELSDFLRYTWVSLLFTQVRGGNHDFTLSEMIRSGELSIYLMRPVGPIEFVYWRGIAEKLLIAVMCLVIGTVAMATDSDFHLGRLWGAMLLALLGNVIHYLVGAAIAAVAFVWEEAYALLMVKNVVVSLLSGEMIPLNLVPLHFAWMWKYLPFYLYVYGPTQYAMGRWTHFQFIESLGIALFWVVVAAATVRATWALGIKRYSSIGG